MQTGQAAPAPPPHPQPRAPPWLTSSTRGRCWRGGAPGPWRGAACAGDGRGGARQGGRIGAGGSMWGFQTEVRGSRQPVADGRGSVGEGKRHRHAALPSLQQPPHDHTTTRPNNHARRQPHDQTTTPADSQTATPGTHLALSSSEFSNSTLKAASQISSESGLRMNASSRMERAPATSPAGQAGRQEERKTGGQEGRQMG